MAEIVGSAVANEAASRLVASFLPRDKTSQQQESVEDKAERLEMAVLKIRSVVAVSEDLHISHLPLLQWKAKLKRVAEEGDDILLHVHKKQQTFVSDNSSTTGNSISQYLIQAAKRFVPFCRKEDEELMSDNTVRRFERFADGADSFFRLVESGGRPKSVFLPPPLTRALLAGDSMEFLIRTKTGSDHIMVWPWLNHPDYAKSGSGLQACLIVSREDEVWQKGLKMCVVFRLSEASNILAIAMSCLEILPPQFDAARVAISRLLTETIGQSGDHSSSLSERSKWCCRHIESHHRNDCESSMGDDKHRGNGMLLLSQPVLRFTAFCYASPCIDRKDGLPLGLECHVSPYLSPEKRSSQYELVEQDVIRKLLPNVTDGFYDDDTQPLSYQRQIWSPQSSMYCAVTPAFRQPLTVSQAYTMESSGTRSRRRMAKTKSQSISKFQNIAKT